MTEEADRTAAAAPDSHETTFAAVAEADALVREVRRGQEKRDWNQVLGEMRKALSRIVETDFVRDDPQAQQILAAMTEPADMAEFDFLADRLRARVAELVAAKLDGTAKDRSRPEAAPALPSGPTLPAALRRAGEASPLGSEPDEAPRRSRTVLRL